MKTRILNYIVFSAIFIWSGGCTREADRDFPRVRTMDAIQINSEGVTLVAEILNNDYFDISGCGFMIFCGPPSAQTLVGSVRGDLDTKTGSFSARPVTGMAGDVTYYYYGYVTSGSITTAGNMCSFTSEGSKPVQIVDFSPSTGQVLDTVNLLFSDLLGGISNIAVTVDEHPAKITGFHDEALRIIVPAELNEREATIRVADNSQVSIYEKKFELKTPQITSISPLEAAPGDTVTINGLNFHREKRFNIISFNSFSTVGISSSTTEIKVIVPMLEGIDCEIRVITSGQEAVSPDNLSITGSPVLWKTVAGFPGGDMYKMGSFVIGYHGYAGLGARINHDYEHRFWKYDPFSDTWERIASCPGRTRIEAYGFAINGKGYIGGGFDYDSPQRAALRDFYEYDPDLDRWKPIVDYPGKLDVSFRGSPQVVDGKAYIAFTYQDFYSYNPALQQWKRLPAPPGGSISSTGASFVIGRDIYYVGGYNSMGINTTEVWSFNTLDGSWTRKSNFPGNPRRYGTGYSVDGKGYLCLGLNGSEVYNDHWMYDPDNDTWIRLGDFPGQARAVALCMMISDMAYIGTGYLGPGNLIGDMYRFNAYSLK